MVDENIEAAEFLFDRCRNPGRVFRAGHVAGMNTRRPAVFCDAGRDRLERVFPPTCEHHARTFLAKRERSGFTDAASGAGDPRNLARQPLHAPVPFARRALTPYQLVGTHHREPAPMMQPQHESKIKLLDATLKVVRTRGYSATRIEDVCAEAGLTKGSFFHHFKSKEDLALSAVAHWDATTSATFATAPYHGAADPLSRVIAYIEFRKALLTGDLPDFTCFVGTIVQETYQTHPEVSAAAAGIISSHARTLEADIRAAMREHKVPGNWTPESLALHFQAVIQGSFILAKAKGSAAAAAESLDHLRRYIELVFEAPGESGAGRKNRPH
jgi:TetR/AcrR family transcriptional repressor of nem operon